MGIEADFRNLVSQSPKQGFQETLAEAQRQEGSFRGQTVEVVQDVQSAIADSLEEASFQNVEKLEQKLSEFKDKASKWKLNTAQLAEMFVQKMSEPQAGQKLQQFMEALKKQGAGLDEQGIRNLVKEFFGDVSDQFLALQYAEESLKGDPGQAALLEKLQKARASLEKEAGPAIRAGLNIIEDVLQFSKQGLAAADALRTFYRYAILGRDSVASMYEAIMKRYGPGQFQQALTFLLQAAGSDLDGKGAHGTSLEHAHLSSAVDNIVHVQYMGNLFRSFEDLLKKVRNY